MELKITVESEDLIPFKKHPKDAGFDLRTKHKATIFPGQDLKISTGVRVQIPQGYMGVIVPRSSTGVNGMALKNTVGIIDADYRGEIFVFIRNYETDRLIKFNKFERFAQLLIVPIALPTLLVCDSLADSDRDIGGFGHTGRQ